MGVLITIKDKLHPFWYPCEKKDVASVVRQHVIHFGRETVNGQTRAIPVAEITAEWVGSWKGNEAQGVEPIDVTKILV